MAAGERSDEVAEVGPPRRSSARGQGGQLQAGDPSLGPLLERGDVRRLEPQAHHVVEEGGRLLVGESQVGRTDLLQLAAGAQARQRQRRVGPGHDRDGDLRGKVVEQERHGLVDRRVVDEVVVVQREHRRPGQRVEVVHQADQHVLGRQPAVGVQQGARLCARLRDGALDGGHEVGEEAAQVAVALVEGEPRDVGRLVGSCRAQPLGHQRGLAEPGGSRDEQQPGHRPRTGAQPVDQPRPCDELTARRRDVQLRAQDRHGVSVGPVQRGAGGAPARDPGVTGTGVVGPRPSRVPRSVRRSTGPCPLRRR